MGENAEETKKKKKVKSQKLASLFNHQQIHKKNPHDTNKREIQMLTSKPAKHWTYQFWCRYTPAHRHLPISAGTVI